MFMHFPGFPGYGYLPTAPTPGERLPAAAAAYYADFGAAAPAHVAGHVTSAVPRSEPSQLSITSSPLHRDQFTQRTTAGITSLAQFSELFFQPKHFIVQSSKKNQKNINAPSTNVQASVS